MNSGNKKGIGQSNTVYQTGDVIYIKSSLGSPGNGWVNPSSFIINKKTEKLYKALGKVSSITLPIIPGYSPWIKT